VLTAVVVDPRSVNAQADLRIARRAPDDELLLVDWLNALIFEMATRRMLFGRFEVQLVPGHWKPRPGANWWKPVSISPPLNPKAPPTPTVLGRVFSSMSGLGVPACQIVDRQIRIDSILVDRTATFVWLHTPLSHKFLYEN